MSSLPSCSTVLADPTAIPWRAILGGLCASLVGIGLARFSYTPLLPSLIEAQWFAANDVVYLGAANLAGYLVGALLGRTFGRRLGNAWALRHMMLLTSAAFLACAAPVSVGWFFFWRLLSGISGGVIMVLVASTVLPHVPAARKGLASGAIFMGLGLGIAASGSLIPVLLTYGLRQTWLGLGALSLALTLLSWTTWPASARRTATSQRSSGQASPGTKRALRIICVEYALMAVAVVPTMVFLADFIARGLGKGVHAGAFHWVMYGLGAIAGPMLYGTMSDRVGASRTLRLVLAVQVAAVALLVGVRQDWTLVLASLLIGTFPPGAVPLVLARVNAAVAHQPGAQEAAWSSATTVFALFQAIAGYGYSYLFALSGAQHIVLFIVGGSALVLALLVGYWGASARGGLEATT